MIVGLTYKSGVADMRNSLNFKIYKIIKRYNNKRHNPTKCPLTNYSHLSARRTATINPGKRAAASTNGSYIDCRETNREPKFDKPVISNIGLAIGIKLK